MLLTIIHIIGRLTYTPQPQWGEIETNTVLTVPSLNKREVENDSFFPYFQFVKLDIK